MEFTFVQSEAHQWLASRCLFYPSAGTDIGHTLSAHGMKHSVRDDAKNAGFRADRDIGFEDVVLHIERCEPARHTRMSEPPPVLLQCTSSTATMSSAAETCGTRRTGLA